MRITDKTNDFPALPLLLAAPLLAALLLLVALLTGWTDAADPPPQARFFLEPDRDGGLWLCVDPSPGELGDGGALALRLTLQLPAGGRWGAITCGAGAEGMVLTVGTSHAEAAIVILLDGYPTGGSSRLARLEPILPSGRETPEVVFSSVDGIYRLDSGGQIQKIPVTADCFPADDEDDIANPGDPRETVDPDGPTTEAPEQDSATGTSADASRDDPADLSTDLPGGSPGDGSVDATEHADAVPSRFAGCQESAVGEDGTYAARFLFRGGTPVICVCGGGVLQAETEAVSLPEGRFSACVFRGLRADRRYLFRVYTEAGVVEAVYEGGEFLGFGEVTRW